MEVWKSSPILSSQSHEEKAKKNPLFRYLLSRLNPEVWSDALRVWSAAACGPWEEVGAHSWTMTALTREGQHGHRDSMALLFHREETVLAVLPLKASGSLLMVTADASVSAAGRTSVCSQIPDGWHAPPSGWSFLVAALAASCLPSYLSSSSPQSVQATTRMHGPRSELFKSFEWLNTW